MTARHVTAEVRTVYRSARGVKLTKHAAYIAAAKKLIADRCLGWNKAIEAAHTATDHNGERVVNWEHVNTLTCHKDCPTEARCRFHWWPAQEPVYNELHGYTESCAPVESYYRRVLDRLVRFLKYVDGRRADA